MALSIPEKSSVSHKGVKFEFFMTKKDTGKNGLAVKVELGYKGKKLTVQDSWEYDLEPYATLVIGFVNERLSGYGLVLSEKDFEPIVKKELAKFYPQSRIYTEE